MNKTLIRNKHLVYTLAYFFIINIVQSLYMELTHDEAYYWFYSKNLAWGYYDHPPMVAWLIKLGTSIFGDNEFGVRIFSNLMQLGTIYYLWLLGGKYSSKLFAVLLLSFPLFAGAGILALPDTPLLFFSVSMIYHTRDFIKQRTYKLAILVSFLIAALFYSKYHGLLVVILAVVANPKIIKDMKFWLIVFIVFVLYIPHMHWQYLHNFITFDFHLNQRSGTGFRFSNIYEYVGSTIVLTGGLASWLVLRSSIKERFGNKDLFLNSVVFIVIILFMTLRNKIEANWIVTASTIAIPLVCIHYRKKNASNIIKLLSPMIITLLVIRYILIQPEFEIRKMGIDRLTEIKSWKRISKEIKVITGNEHIYTDTYQVAAKMSFYLKENIPALHIRGRKSHYSLVKNNIENEKKISFVSIEKISGATVIKTGYKDDLYIATGITLSEVKSEILK